MKVNETSGVYPFYMLYMLSGKLLVTTTTTTTTTTTVIIITSVIIKFSIYNMFDVCILNIETKV